MNHMAEMLTVGGVVGTRTALSRAVWNTGRLATRAGTVTRNSLIPYG